ncbi:Proton channel OtopLc [Anthophora retusa]
MERELAVGTATPRRHPDPRSDRSVIAEQTSCRRVRVRILYQPFPHTDRTRNNSTEEMQRCPYLHEMKERLLSQPTPTDSLDMERLDGTPVKEANLHNDYPAHTNPGVIPDPPEMPPDSLIGTVVKLNSDGYGSHTSPAHARQPLVPQNTNNPPLCLTPTHSSPANGTLPKNAKTSLFIIMSFIYAKLLVVVCIAYVISEVVTHKLPLYYYEGFFTYLYGVSILFLLYVFCFLLQESTCCLRGSDTPQPPRRPSKPPKEPKEKNKKDKKDKEQKAAKTKKEYQDAADVEAGVATRALRKRKTSQNDQSHGSFFLRIGAIAFGLGTMVYNGLEFGTFFEVPPSSPCYQILQGVNPVLQMIFTFMQMYFIFMNSRLNIHRFKVIARFGLMHVVATNLCVWIRTLVLESIKEITKHHQKMGQFEAGILESIKQHSMKNAGAILGTAPRDMALLQEAPLTATRASTVTSSVASTTAASLGRVMRTTARAVARAVTTPTTTTTAEWNPPTSTTTSTSAPLPNLTTTTVNTLSTLLTTLTPQSSTEERTSPTTTSTTSTSTTSTTPSTTFSSFFIELFDAPQPNNKEEIHQIFDVNNQTNSTEYWSRNFGIFAEALTDEEIASNSCGRVNIMGTIVQDAEPYLFPFIIEYSLIGAAVIYVMWKHIGYIGRHPRWPHQVEADLERRLEAMLSRRAVALAHAGHTRVDCVGASKGLFFGLLLLVGSLICLILFFVLIHHPDFGLVAIYLADVSHCVLMVLSIVAIIVGFIRVQSLKFKAEEQSDLNDILLRVSGFGLFVYAVFSVIAGSLAAFTHEPNLLVMLTGLLSVAQVILQMLFIADVSRRRVHLPEHDRSKPGRQVVTFLLICNLTMWVIYTFESQKVMANPVQLDFYGFLAWAIVQRVTLPLCIFHRFHSAVTFAEIWKTSYKARLD